MSEQCTKQLHLMGTVIDVTVTAEFAEQIADETISLLYFYEKMFSANREDSELMTVNQAAGITPIVVSPELFELVSIGKHHSMGADSFLNIAIGPLIKEWKIGFDGAKIPSNQEINRLLKYTDPENIELNQEEKSIYLKKRGMEIDLGALAKGYIADKIVDYYKEKQVHSAILNLGGNVVVYGQSHHPDEMFRVGIQNPKEPRSQCLTGVKAKNQSVVTSGIYERVLKVNNQEYNHIINPKTGYPVETNVASLTILSDLSVDGEIWTTRLFGKNSLEIVNKVNDLQNIECVVIDKDNKIYVSEGIKSKLI